MLTALKIFLDLGFQTFGFPSFSFPSFGFPPLLALLFFFYLEVDLALRFNTNLVCTAICLLCFLRPSLRFTAALSFQFSFILSCLLLLTTLLHATAALFVFSTSVVFFLLPLAATAFFVLSTGIIFFLLPLAATAIFFFLAILFLPEFALLFLELLLVQVKANIGRGGRARPTISGRFGGCNSGCANTSSDTHEGNITLPRTHCW